MLKTLFILSGLALYSSSSIVNAGAILSATSGTINSGGPGFGTLTETFDQSGLSVGYTSGVTDFDAYIALGPTHTDTFGGFEWFSNSGTSSASVTYDLGGIFSIDALALWNEESSGIGSLDLLTSTDGVTFTSLVSGLLPTDHFAGAYSADVFNFSAVNAQYIQFDMSGCPQPNVGSFSACSIGEVAFREAGAAQVPVPGTIVLLGLGIAGLGSIRRKRTN
ncbi:MAG: discoidin domain-containing protein [Sedimenticola thiotaurini]|uniref:Discoidin domain-containing protein n=1 Tax=Sedimenticola thiotaurini TaxID=1543721 RepID=A0A558DFX2_9GAMM|nr:MAG: discoidin domain-containing protein [Sedimenticola thiotaurini]